MAECVAFVTGAIMSGVICAMCGYRYGCKDTLNDAVLRGHGKYLAGEFGPEFVWFEKEQPGRESDSSDIRD